MKEKIESLKADLQQVDNFINDMDRLHRYSVINWENDLFNKCERYGPRYELSVVRLALRIQIRELEHGEDTVDMVPDEEE